MKIQARGIESFLAAPEKQCRAALFYGPDAGLAQERAKRLRDWLLAGNSDPFALVEIEESKLLEDPARFADEILSMGLLGGKRVIVLRDAGDKSTKIIEQAAEHFHDGAFIIVMAGELGPRSSLRVWFEGYPQAASLPCYRDEARDIGALVRDTLSKARITADRDAVEYLSQQLGNDRGVTRQELEKIATYAGEGGTFSLEEAQALTDYSRDTQLDDVAQALADKDLSALDTMLEVHRREGTAPVAYLRAALRYFNRLYFIQARLAAGERLEEIIGSLKPKVFFKQEDALKRHIRHWGTAQIVRAMALILQAELACKTSDIPPLPASGRKLMQAAQVR